MGILLDETGTGTATTATTTGTHEMEVQRKDMPGINNSVNYKRKDKSYAQDRSIVIRT